MDRRKRSVVFYFLGVMALLFSFQIGLGYEINLNKGWNLISLPGEPANTAIDQVTSPIHGKFNSIWSYVDGSWKLYDPEAPDFSNLLSMEPGWGYWIEMKEGGMLSGSGTAASSPLQLIAGWNLVGYGCGSLGISSALASIDGKYDSVWGFKNGLWKQYDPGNPNSSDLTTMDPGFGYWIVAKESTTWTCPGDYTPRPVVPGETTPESSGKVTVTGTSSQVGLSDGTEVSFEGMGEGNSVTLTMERASNTIDMGDSSIATSGSMRIMTVDKIANNGTGDGSSFAPVLTIPQKEIGSLNVETVNILRISANPDTGQEDWHFLPAFQNQKGDLTFRDWLMPTDVLEEKAQSARAGDSFVSKASGPKVIKYSAVTVQNEGNTAIAPELIRMVPAKDDAWKRKPISAVSLEEEQKELKKPVQNVVLFVHGHNEMEKTGFEKGNRSKPWFYDYKRDVWNYMYDKFSSDFSDRKDSTVFYEFIYPSWRSIYRHLNDELARKVKEALAPQLKNGMKFNLFIVAHSMGGLVSRAGLVRFEAQLKDNLQHLVTWGSPHHGSPLNSLRFALSSPALASRQNTATTKLIRYAVEGEVVPTQGVLDCRWTTASLTPNYTERLQLDKVFRWYGDKTDPKAWEKWNTDSGTMLYNEDLRQMNINDDMGNKHTFLYGITKENLKLKDWGEFDVATLYDAFMNLSATGKGATFAYLLMGNPSSKFMNGELGDSDGVAPVISMAGYGITSNALFVGYVDHEQYFNNSTYAPKTAGDTYQAMDFSNKKYASPWINLTSPAVGQTFKAEEKVPVAGQMIWPGDDKPGKRIKQIQVKRSSSDRSIVLKGPIVKDDGNFSGEFAAGDLGDTQDGTSTPLTVLSQFKDDTELEKEASIKVIKVGGDPLKANSCIPTACPGKPYYGLLTATGGFPPYAYEIVGGSLPPGLTLNKSTGVISGTIAANESKNYQFSSKVTDSKGQTASWSATISRPKDQVTQECCSDSPPSWCIRCK